MMSEERLQKFHTDDMLLNRPTVQGVGSASDSKKKVSLVA